jgi:short subunit dehydrogenase-like uncharacterized protein
MAAFDLVLHGATGFTGGLAAREIARSAPSGLKWAVSGRNPERIAQLGFELGVESIVTDGLDPQACAALAEESRVVVSCAGPYQQFGSELLAACAARGTHYADLSGEVGWIWQMIQEHHASAQRSGAVILPASGFDSVPSDLGVATLVRMLAQQERPVGDLTAFYRLKGGLNGGTLASGLSQADAWSAEDLTHPFLLDPDPEASWQDRLMPPAREAGFDVPALEAFGAPFVMAPVNERVVRRSAALADAAGHSYGAEFSYSEWMRTSTAKRARQLAFGLRVTDWMLRSHFGRRLTKRFGPKPGEGPTEQVRSGGFVELSILAGPLDRPDARLDWFFPGDPGNTVTVRCLIQVGLALAAGEARDAGLLTPAYALGSRLVERLRARDALLDAF